MNADYRLTSTNRIEAKAEARKLLRKIRRANPNVQSQFSQHAPEGYAHCYSVQFFADLDTLPADQLRLTK